MLSTGALLLAIAYLPGAIIFRLPFFDRAKRASLAAEERLFWVVVISVAVSTTIAFGLAAIDGYSLERLAGLDAFLAILLALTSAGRLRLEPSAPRPGWSAALPAALIAGCVWMYFSLPASEYLIGGRDPGVYMNEGIQIAQRRSLVTREALVAEIPASTRDLFFPDYGQAGYYSVRYMGFHLRDPQAGTVTGQFPQGYPIWIAIAYGLDGITGTRRVTAWWAILGVLAVYFAARRVTGAIPAAAAAGLLAIHVIQTWYARYPNSEIMAQALLFAALLAHAYAHEDRDRFFGPIAASLLGIGLFTRFPFIVAAAVAAGASLLPSADGRRLRAGFLLTLSAWIAAAGWYYTTQLAPYFSRPTDYFRSLGPVYLVPLSTAVALVCVILWAIRRPAFAAMVRRWLPPVLIVVTVVAGIYALYFRAPGGHLAAHDAHSVRMFAYLYFTPMAFGLALAGYALVVWRSFWRAPALILTITTLAFLFLYKMRIYPEHFWLARRFIPAILPGALVFAAAAAFAPRWSGFQVPARWSRVWRPLTTAAGIAIVLVLGQHYLMKSGSIRTHIEYAGLIPRLEHLANRFGDDDLVLVESREASDVHVLALPLSYIYAKNTLVLYRSRPDKPSVLRFLSWARQTYKNVYLIAGGGTDLLTPGLAAEIIANERFQVPEYARTTYDVYPGASVFKPFDFTIYRLVESSSTTPPTSLDIGGADDLYLVDFHPKERLGGGNLTFRWTGASSYLLIGVSAQSRELMLRLSNGRPDRAAPAAVSVYLGDLKLGTATPTREFREYRFPIPEGAAFTRPDGLSEIRIDSTTWTPRDALGAPDDRRLGVMIDLAEIR